ncbi:MAG TPA: sigma-70 family RNA polymerase sigma factor [Kofleriaceae bacterium]|nr:sigma-70 family RNA polymerase sigma factor [Kofleriaceae bacterium]
MTTAAVPWSDVAARLRPFVARRVPPSEIDDVVQDVLVRMHRGFPALRDDDRFAAWMFQVARNAIVDKVRTTARTPVANADIDETPALPADDDREAATALAGCVSLFVAQLPAPYREALTLVELEGRTAKQAAEMIGISVSGMKSRVQRGRAQLRALFEECCEIAVDVRGKPTRFSPRDCPKCR